MAASRGDVNGDGAVNIIDVTALRLFLAGGAVSIAETAADIDGDGQITSEDVAALRLHMVGQPLPEITPIPMPTPTPAPSPSVCYSGTLGAGGAPWALDSRTGIVTVGGGSTVNPRDGMGGLWAGQNHWMRYAPASTDLRPQVTAIEFTAPVIAGSSLNRFFSDFPALERIGNIHFLDTGAVTDMGSMFSGAAALTSLDLSAWNTVAVTHMDFMFSGASSLERLGAAGWNTGAVFNMMAMFLNTASLAELDISGWNTSSVRMMNGMFSGAASLTSLDLSGWDTSSVTEMGTMFSGTSSLVDLNLSGWDVSNAGMEFFLMGSEVENLNLSGWNIGPNSDIGAIFFRANSLGRVTIPPGLLVSGGSSLAAGIPTWDFFNPIPIYWHHAETDTTLTPAELWTHWSTARSGEETWVRLPSPPPLTASEFERRVFELTNIERAKEGWQPLIWCDGLAAVSREHSEDLAANNIFGHQGSDGSSPEERVLRAGIPVLYNGENVAGGRRTPEAMVESWMNSTGHRNNILDPWHTHLGVGFARLYGSQWTYYATQKFGIASPGEQALLEIAERARIEINAAIAERGLPALAVNSFYDGFARLRAEENADRLLFWYWTTPEEFGITGRLAASRRTHIHNRDAHGETPLFHYITLNAFLGSIEQWLGQGNPAPVYLAVGVAFDMPNRGQNYLVHVYVFSCGE